MATLTQAAARRIALAAQGFVDRRPQGQVDVRHFRRVMDRMTVLQLDSVNVVCRSHYLPVLARLGPYDRDRLNRYLYRSGEHYEFVAHEASFTSQELHPVLRYRSRYRRWRTAERLQAEVPGYIQSVLDEVTREGVRSVKTLADPGARTGPWWGRSKGKVALEWLFISGRLNVVERDHMFVTQYDLPERVLRPDVLGQPEWSEREAKKRLLELGARSHGVGTLADIADYFRLRVPEVRPLMAELVAEGRVEQVEVRGWDRPAYLHAVARRPRSVSNRALLSPFDPVVWFRPRAARLFDFDFRIEIYVPPTQRVHGYYVLPFLLDDELVARVDLKADRQDRALRVRGSYLERAVAAGPHGPARTDRVATELSAALAEMARWLDLDGVRVEPKGDLADVLVKAVART